MKTFYFNVKIETVNCYGVEAETLEEAEEIIEDMTNGNWEEFYSGGAVSSDISYEFDSEEEQEEQEEDEE